MNIMPLVQGAIVGFSIAAPVGPNGVLCIRRTAAQGFPAGFLTGLGAATVHAVYGAVAILGLQPVTDYLLDRGIWLKLIDAGILGWLGYKIFSSAPEERGTPLRGSLIAAYVSTLCLTLVNPMTLISFGSLLTGLNAGRFAGELTGAGSIVLGIFTGSSLWWAILSGLITTMRSRLRLRQIQWINRAAGALIAGFGLAVLAAMLRQG